MILGYPWWVVAALAVGLITVGAVVGIVYRRRESISRIEFPRSKRASRTGASVLGSMAFQYVLGSIIAVVVIAGLFYATLLYVGVISAVVYWVMFLVGIAILPFLIALGGSEIPFSTAIARVHIMLGAIAFNHHYLVDMGDRWEWYPGEEERVYIEGQWYDIDGGFENRSVLGWRPFGILRFKDEDTFKDIRADTKAERGRRMGGSRHNVTADGGEIEIERGGYAEVEKPLRSGIDGMWLVDLKRLFSRGVRKFGDVELIETTEEVIERGEVTESKIEGWKPIIGALLGLVVGLPVFYLIFFG